MKFAEFKMKDFYKAPRALTEKEMQHVSKYMMRKWGKLSWFWGLFKNYGLKSLPKDIKQMQG